MCIIAAKYFKDIGWIFAKNRDQDYVPNVSFRDEHNDKVGEIFVMYDNDIKYQEGMNHDGLVIITTSLTPSLLKETNKEDGDRIYKALHMSQDDAVNFLIKEKMTGFIFVGTPTKLVVIEAAKKEQGEGEYKSKVRVAPTTETVVCTNHGIYLPWAGFQYGISDNQNMWRKSSETRKNLAHKALEKANSPEEMLDALAQRMENDLQMNLFRVERKPRQMRTVFQWALIPTKSESIVRPIQTKMHLKISKQKITVEVLDNEYIKKIYDGAIRHFSKIKSTSDEEYDTVITESRIPLRFLDYSSDNA